jgi:bifunctional non-homologous end joining protein LigD
MRLRLVKEPFDNPEYLFELKHDGFRALVYLENGGGKLVSRNLKNLRFDSLKAALARLPVRNAILDGEIICIDGKGVSQFNQLLSRRTEPIFYAFDLLWLNDEDLRSFPLITRKQRLKNLLQSTGHSHIMYAQHVETQGRLFFDEICTRDLEGIVAKPKLSIYKDGGNSWLKIKNRNYSQAEGRHELLTKR